MKKTSLFVCVFCYNEYVKTPVPHFGAGRRSRPWVVALLLLKIFLAKKVDVCVLL
jgi:hypothetical protein